MVWGVLGFRVLGSSGVGCRVLECHFGFCWHILGFWGLTFWGLFEVWGGSRLRTSGCSGGLGLRFRSPWFMGFRV